MADLSDFELLRDELGAWQFFYNWQIPHGSLSEKSPSQIVSELGEKAPFWDEVISKYEINNERIQGSNYFLDLSLRKLKGSL